MLNNKGQSLVLFVVILPILLLIVVLVVDIGKIFVLKQELDNINEIVLDYGLNYLDKENLKEELIDLIKLNNDEIDEINIQIENNKIHIELHEDVNGMFSGFVDISIFNVESSYIGYFDNNNKRIEEISG